MFTSMPELPDAENAAFEPYAQKPEYVHSHAISDDYRLMMVTSYGAYYYDLYSDE